MISLYFIMVVASNRVMLRCLDTIGYLALQQTDFNIPGAPQYQIEKQVALIALRRLSQSHSRTNMHCVRRPKFWYTSCNYSNYNWFEIIIIVWLARVIKHLDSSERPWLKIMFLHRSLPGDFSIDRVLSY